MPSSFVHALLPTSCLLASPPQKEARTGRQKLLLIAIAVIACNLPDLDIIPGLLWKGHLADTHRAWGHNIFSIIGFTALTAWMFAKAKLFTQNPWQRWTISAMLVVSHVFLDGLGHFNSFDYEPAVPLLWPLSSYGFTFPFRIFITMDLIQDGHLAFSIFSAKFWTEILLCEMVPSAVLFFFWVISLRVIALAKKLGFPFSLSAFRRTRSSSSQSQ